MLLVVIHAFASLSFLFGYTQQKFIESLRVKKTLLNICSSLRRLHGCCYLLFLLCVLDVALSALGAALFYFLRELLLIHLRDGFIDHAVSRTEPHTYKKTKQETPPPNVGRGALIAVRRYAIIVERGKWSHLGISVVWTESNSYICSCIMGH